jgi:hypothetical protein
MGFVSEKEVYVCPEIEIIEFEFEESIAASGESESKGAAFFDELWD